MVMRLDARGSVRWKCLVYKYMYVGLAFQSPQKPAGAGTSTPCATGDGKIGLPSDPKSKG